MILIICVMNLILICLYFMASWKTRIYKSKLKVFNLSRFNDYPIDGSRISLHTSLVKSEYFLSQQKCRIKKQRKRSKK